MQPPHDPVISSRRRYPSLVPVTVRAHASRLVGTMGGGAGAGSLERGEEGGEWMVVEREPVHVTNAVFGQRRSIHHVGPSFRIINT